MYQSVAIVAVLRVLPVAKAGKSGKLKSLHVFVSEKHCKFALRFYTGLPLINNVKTSVTGIEPVDFKLMSLPLYLIGQTKRLTPPYLLMNAKHFLPGHSTYY